MPIRNMNRAIRFYTKSLGGKLNDRGRGRMKDYWASVQLWGSEIWLIYPEKREPRAMAYSAVLVRNIKSLVTRLKRNGVKFQRAEKMSSESKIDGPIAYEEYGASAFFKDPEGNLLMIWQNKVPM